jgi:hypothetical protein
VNLICGLAVEGDEFAIDHAMMPRNARLNPPGPGGRSQTGANWVQSGKRGAVSVARGFPICEEVFMDQRITDDKGGGIGPNHQLR